MSNLHVWFWLVDTLTLTALLGAWFNEPEYDPEPEELCYAEGYEG